MNLFQFQSEASEKIAGRFWEYMLDPLMIRRTQPVPFYQNLAAITGAGKTLILADAIEQIRGRLPIEPVVLWLSKGRVVVWQTYANLSTGKYADLVERFEVKPLLECKPDDVTYSARGLLLVATVGKFNQRDKEKGDRKIFQTQLDDADQSLWGLLKARRDASGRRRQLIIVYDEGHNLSNQQTLLLMELEPDALIAASATTRVPQALTPTIERLRREKSWADEDLVTTVSSSEVVKFGLVKKQIMLGGYMTPMETAIDDLLAAMKEAETSAVGLGLSLRPKAIYVSNTNAADGITIKDDMARPFRERRARPILIWRHLVEHAGIDPENIAVYNDLKFDKRLPPPPGFNLFSGGDSDYDRFMAGDYRHIIFNLSLQEGWDDPACAFAYIDKEMGSPDQVTQIVGRVLRQPGAQHYASSNLNTAHFYIRTDERAVFQAILADVERKLAAESPEISITVRRETHGGNKPYKEPLRPRQVPTVSVDSTYAHAPVAAIVEATNNYRNDTDNTVGKGGRIQVLQTIGEGTSAVEEWVEVAHSNRVTARWVMRREVQRLFPSRGDREHNPINLCDIEDARFDALLEYSSRAAEHIREQAHKIVDAYVEHSTIVQNALDEPYTVGSVLVDETKMVRFRHAVHEGYSDLNPSLERPFAEALDKTRRVWCRNPSAGGFSIPLLDHGNTRTFRPDFLVWVDNQVVAIDTKGPHLLTVDVMRKLFFIDKIEDGPELVIRMVSEGIWHVAPTGLFSRTGGSAGEYSVWIQRQGRAHVTPCKSLSEAVDACLRTGQT